METKTSIIIFFQFDKHMVNNENKKSACEQCICVQTQLGKKTLVLVHSMFTFPILNSLERFLMKFITK